MKTIKELADELEVSKTTIRNHLNKLPDNLSVTKKNNILHLDTDVEAFIKDRVKRVSDNVSENGLYEQHIMQERISILEERNKELKDDNEYLREQIKYKNKDTERLHQLLDQQQQLHNNAMQDLDTYKQERDNLLELKEEQEESKGFWARLFGDKK
ncbi:HTH domain-containing protein [Staphylococcus xylosus]|uniref:ArsR family transcriptional regulator n=1 Tax=Staphylococcus xylosus TaxID=1288 RepID=UPI000E68EC47|nr:HTH domain-containing protein [Staphylococcus xylosus]RIM77083.1 HTH domain-containing protein [Staphylococcus xylosus]